jgi:flavin-binding protein dodecin
VRVPRSRGQTDISGTISAPRFQQPSAAMRAADAHSAFGAPRRTDTTNADIVACKWLATVARTRIQENTMSVARITEITAESAESFDAAIREGITRASKTIKNLQNVWIKDQEVLIKNDQPQAYRVTMKVTFVLND